MCDSNGVGVFLLPSAQDLRPVGSRGVQRKIVDNLRELFYDRNPGDARVKVGSERQAASRPVRRMSTHVAVAEIHGYHM